MLTVRPMTPAQHEKKIVNRNKNVYLENGSITRIANHGDVHKFCKCFPGQVVQYP